MTTGEAMRAAEACVPKAKRGAPMGGGTRELPTARPGPGPGWNERALWEESPVISGFMS